MLYVINIGFERVNAKFFRILDKNARSHLELSHMLRFTWWRLLAVRVDFFIFAFFLLRCLLLLCFFIFIFLPFIWFQIWKNPKYYWSISWNFAQKKNCPNLKNWSWFLEPYGPTTVRTGPYFFFPKNGFWN